MTDDKSIFTPKEKEASPHMPDKDLKERLRAIEEWARDSFPDMGLDESWTIESLQRALARHRRDTEMQEWHEQDLRFTIDRLQERAEAAEANYRIVKGELENGVADAKEAEGKNEKLELSLDVQLELYDGLKEDLKAAEAKLEWDKDVAKKNIALAEHVTRLEAKIAERA